MTTINRYDRDVVVAAAKAQKEQNELQLLIEEIAALTDLVSIRKAELAAIQAALAGDPVTTKE